MTNTRHITLTIDLTAELGHGPIALPNLVDYPRVLAPYSALRAEIAPTLRGNFRVKLNGYLTTYLRENPRNHEP